MITALVHRDGQTRQVDAVDPAWLAPGASELMWVDIELPDPGARAMLEDVFQVHELALEDALSAIHHQKIELYDRYLYLILHGIALKQDVAALRRVTIPQRDALGRLARREFSLIPDAIAYRFRDVYDHLVQLTDESIFFQDRVSGLLDAYLSSQSNRLNQVMKVLTVISTIFMPLTVLTGMYSMNVQLPQFPGGSQMQFWWIIGIVTVIVVTMLSAFRRRDWL